MCESYGGNILRRPIVKDDLTIIKQHYGIKHAQLLEAVFDAVTKDLFVPVPVFVTIADLVIRQLDNMDEGRMPFGSRLRFSALVPNSLTRYQSPEMLLIHDSIATFNMADLNRRLLNKALECFGISIVMDCCCGSSAVPTEVVNSYLMSSDYCDGNRLRTLADSYGSIEQVSSIEHIPDNLLPPHEKQAYRRIMQVSRNVVTTNIVVPSDLINAYLSPQAGVQADQVSRKIPEALAA